MSTPSPTGTAPTTAWRNYVSIGFLATGVLVFLELVPAFGYGEPLNWVGLLLAALAVFAPIFAVLYLGTFQGRSGPLGGSRAGQLFVLLSVGFYITDATTSDYYELASNKAAWSAGLLASLFGLFLTLSLVVLGILLIRAGTLLGGIAAIIAGLAECFTTLASIPQAFGSPTDADTVIYAIAYLVAGALFLLPRKSIANS